MWLSSRIVEPIEPRDAKKVSKNKIIYLATGSQGEPMGAMTRYNQRYTPRC